MSRTFLRSKIHRATVTDKNLSYEGSITLDPKLMEAAGILPYEKVHVLNLNNGSRFETYVIVGRANSGQVCINGAAARLAEKGDLVIILTYETIDLCPPKGYHPKIVKVNSSNKIVKTRKAG